MKIAIIVFLIVLLIGFSFTAGRLFERLFGDYPDFLKEWIEGWNDGFDDGMKFAKENKGLIDHYKGKGVWAVGECEDDFKEVAK